MDLRRLFAKRAVVWLVLGLIGGGIAADIWWRQRTRTVDQQLKQLQASAESEHARVESQLSATSGEVKRLKEEVERLTEQLTAERDLRHRYEDLASRGQK